MDTFRGLFSVKENGAGTYVTHFKSDVQFIFCLSLLNRTKYCVVDLPVVGGAGETDVELHTVPATAHLVVH